MKMQLKKIGLTVILAGMFHVPAMAQIPTTDVASITAQAIQMLEQMNQLIDQYDSLREQIDNQNKQIDAMTGGRGLSGAVGTDDYNQIPTNWEETLNQMNGGSLSSQANDILSTMNKIDIDAYQELDEAYDEHFGKDASQAASYQALQGKSYNDTAERFAKLKELMQKIDDTEDVKAAIDLNSRIQAEMAMLLNEQMKLNSLAQLNVSQQQLQEVKTNQMRTEHNKPKNMTFDFD